MRCRIQSAPLRGRPPEISPVILLLSWGVGDLSFCKARVPPAHPAFSGAEATSCQLLSAACSRSHMISSGGQRMLLVCIKRALDGESSGRVECVSVTSCLE